MADNKHIPGKDGSSPAESDRSRNFSKKRTLPAPFAAFVMIKNEASSKVPRSKLSTIKPAEHTERLGSLSNTEDVSSQVPTTGPEMVEPEEETTREESPSETEAVSSQVPTTGPAMVEPAEETTKVEILSKIEAVSSQIPTTGPEMVEPEEETTREESPSKTEAVSSQVPTTGPAMIEPTEETTKVEIPSKIEAVSSQVPTTGPAMVKPEETTRVENSGMIEAGSSQGLATGPAMVKPAEKTTVESLPFVLEGNVHVSSKWQSQVDFHKGMNTSSRRNKDIRSGIEPMLGGIEGVHQDIQHLTDRIQRLSEDNEPFFQIRREPSMDLLAFDFEDSARLSSEMEGLFEFCYGMNRLSTPDPDIRSESCPTPGGMEGVDQGIQHLSDGVQGLSVNSCNSPFIHNSRTVPITMLTSGVEGDARASFDRDAILGFHNDMNASGRRYEGIHSGNEEMLGAVGGFYYNTQQLWEDMHRINVNIPSPSEDLCLRYELSQSDIDNLGIGLLTTGLCNSPIVSPGRLYGIEFPSHRQFRELHLSSDPLDKRVADDAEQLFSAFNENIQQAENPDLTSSGISEEYLKLYQERIPGNYDFAMNIMAHIELLNDSSWTATVSYFDENVKRMVSSIWNKTHSIFQNAVKLQEYNSLMVLKLIRRFTQLSSVNENFKVETFLKYSVILCQLAVVTRKSIFKKAPFYVILQIRNRLKYLKSENLVQFVLNVVAEDYTKRQHEM